MGTANLNDHWGQDDECERSGQWPNEAIGTGKQWGMRVCLVLWPHRNTELLGPHHLFFVFVVFLREASNQDF